MRARATSVLLYVFVLGCASASPSIQDQSTDEEEIQDYVTDIYCFPSFAPESTANFQPPSSLPVPEVEKQPDVLTFLSPASRKIAQVIQVENLVAQIPMLEHEVARDIPGAANIRLIELRQALSDQVLVALFDAFSVAAELECEKGRADALVSGMEEKQTDVQQHRTVIALLADATAGLLSGI